MCGKGDPVKCISSPNVEHSSSPAKQDSNLLRGFLFPPSGRNAKPSFRSDVFSIGLIVWRLLAGEWPEWPFEWPAKGYSKLRGRIHPDFIDFMRRAIDVNPRHRYRDAQQMLAVFLTLKYRTLRHARARRRASA